MMKSEIKPARVSLRPQEVASGTTCFIDYYGPGAGQRVQLDLITSSSGRADDDAILRKEKIMRSIDEIRADWRQRLHELQEAQIAYEPFIARALPPGVNPIPIQMEDLRAAKDRLWSARQRIREIEQECVEAVRDT